MAELLLELFSEEIPARMQQPVARQFKEQVEAKLKAEELYYKSIETHATPRRLVLVVDGLSLTQEDKIIERRGPRADAPAKAIEGFLKSSGLSFDQLTKKETDKGAFYFAVIQHKGKSTKEVLGTLLAEAVAEISWPKSMRWGGYDVRWVRPLKSICCIFGGEVLKLKFGPILASDESYGHRFLSPDAFKVVDFKHYKDELQKRHVILDVEERKASILEQAEKLAEAKELKLYTDPHLLDEVAGLVEWPNVLLGNIEDEFMQVPDEVLISSIRKHQKYFCLKNKKGNLAPHFLVASNMSTSDKGAAIIAGNERVLRARLADAVFFWEQDKKTKLDERLEALDKVVFHARLGTIGEKVERIKTLVQYLAVWVPHANLKDAAKAASLCKADLVTEMVGEFPDLQGTMGYYYALEQGEDPSIALAIKEHYQPQGPNDETPKEALGVAIALSDKIDTLTGLFAIGEKPTGSKDPFALRRAALGVIRIIIENGLSIPLKLAFEKSLAQHPKSLFSAEKEKIDEDAPKKGKLLKKVKHSMSAKVKPADVVDDLLEFFVDRLKVLLKSNGVRHDYITAIFASGNEDDFLRLTRRVAALAKFLETENGQNLLAAYRRAANITSIEEKKDKTSYKGAPVKLLLESDEEKALFKALSEAKTDIKKLLKEEEYETAMNVLSKLRTPVDDFFEKVKVNADKADVRKNRLMMLSTLRELVNELADFSQIEG
jgi:glycyl-tRNA synthetase beta chain